MLYCLCPDSSLFYISEDVSIVGGASGIHMTYTREGRPTGECYIELASDEDVEKALKKHNEHLGPRYIEGNKSPW